MQVGHARCPLRRERDPYSPIRLGSEPVDVRIDASPPAASSRRHSPEYQTAVDPKEATGNGPLSAHPVRRRPGTAQPQRRPPPPPRRRPQSATAVETRSRRPPRPYGATLDVLEVPSHIAGTSTSLGPTQRYVSGGAVPRSQGQTGGPRFILQPRKRVRGPQRPPHVTGVTDTHLAEATLIVSVRDRLTSAPVQGAAVLVAEFGAFLQGHVMNAGATKQRTSKVDTAGRTRCTVLASRR